MQDCFLHNEEKNPHIQHADLVELVYTLVLGTSAFGRVGSTPTIGTKLVFRAANATFRPETYISRRMRCSNER